MGKILHYILNLLLPQSKNVELLERMSPEELKRMTCKEKIFLSDLSLDTLVVFDYKNTLIRQAIWELKYRGNKKVAKLLAECLYEELVGEITERATFENFGKPLLLGIPLSKKRERERGFNQCDLLVSALSTLDNGSFFGKTESKLEKIRDTESQTKKTRTERLSNLKGCFRISKPEKIRDRSIILLDDVTTTGATLEEASKILYQAGAKKVLKVAVAH